MPLCNLFLFIYLYMYYLALPFLLLLSGTCPCMLRAADATDDSILDLALN